MTARDTIDLHSRYRLRVEDYLLLDRSGAFDGLRTELVGGEVIIVNAEYRPHGYLKTELGYRIRDALVCLGGSWTVLIDTSISVGRHDMPVPDIVVTCEPRGDGAVPLDSIGLLVEIAASTLTTDLTDKAVLYARAGVPEYWVVDIDGRNVRQMWQPGEAGYNEARETPFGHPVASATIGGLEIGTDGV